jgi:hypothetical protein
MENNDLLAVVARSIVRPSFHRCSEHGNDFFDKFYATLANRAPVGALFANTNMRTQNTLVRDGIDHLIAFAEGREGSRAELERLGQRHSRHELDVSPELYAAWVEALVIAVAEYDSLHNPDLDVAWRHVVAKGIDVMISYY